MDTLEKLAASALWMMLVVVLTAVFLAVFVWTGVPLKRTLAAFALSFLLISSVRVQGSMTLPAAAGFSSLPAGNYVSTVIPAPDRETARVIQETLQGVSGVDSADIDGGSSALRITIKNGCSVLVGDLQQALRYVDSNFLMTVPQKEAR